MTDTAIRVTAAPSIRALTPQAALEHVSGAAFLATFLLVVTPASGGRDRSQFLVGLVALVPALVAMRPWRRLGRVALALPLVLASASTVVMLTTPTGWSNSRFPAYLLFGSLVFVAAASYATTTARRSILALALAAAGLLQFQQAFTPWWGSGDPNHLMWGTFYWHNQFAAYVVACGLVAMALALTTTGLLRVVAAGCTAVAGAAVVFSTSRTSLGLFVIGWLALAPLAWRHSSRKAALAVWAAVPVLVAATVAVLTSPVFFPDNAYHFYLLPHDGGAGGRDVSSLHSNGSARLLFNEAALRIWSDRPVVGAGFGAFGTAAVDHMPLGSGLSAFPHNGYANAFVSGGLLLGLPVLLTSLFMLARCARAAVRVFRVDSERGVLAGATVATLVLLAHSVVDFDWTYPSLCGLLGLAFAIVYSSTQPAPARRRRPGAAVAGIALLALPLALAAVAAGHDRWHHAFQAGTRSADLAASRMLDAAGGPMHDPQLAANALNIATSPTATGTVRLDVDEATAQRALSATTELADVDPPLQMQRALTLVAMGRTTDGLSLASRTVERYSSHRPYLVGDLAAALATAGQQERARGVAAAAVQTFVEQPATEDAAWYLVAFLERLDGSSPSPTTTCAYAAAAAAFGAPPTTVRPLDAPCELTDR